MYLNIIEYVEIEKHENLLGMINMAEKYQGLIAQIKNEGFEDGEKKGFENGEKSIIFKLLQTFSIEVVADLLNKDIHEINEIIKK